MSGAPVPLLGAYLGGLWDHGLEPARGRVVVEVALPIDEWADIRRITGLAPSEKHREALWDDGGLARVVILQGRTPHHPETEADVIAAAAVDMLVRGLQGGTVRLTPALVGKLDALRDLLDGRPIIVAGSPAP